MVLHNISLLEYNSVFEVYRVQTLPIPYTCNGENARKRTMSAYYDLNGINTKALNKLPSHNTILTSKQLETCERARLTNSDVALT